MLDQYAQSGEVRVEYRGIAFLDQMSTSRYSSRAPNVSAWGAGQVNRAGAGLAGHDPRNDERGQAGRAQRLTPAFGVGLVLGGVLGLAAAFMLAVDKYQILEDPSFQPSCNLNPILSCGSVMVTDQAELFGFPNPLIGVISFTVVIVLGLLVAARVPLPRWVVGGLATGAVLGSVFVHWLLFQSLYRIGALCPWCMVVWGVTIPIAVWTTLLFAHSVSGPSSRVADELWDWRYLVVACWYIAIVALATERFWIYWRTLL